METRRNEKRNLRFARVERIFGGKRTRLTADDCEDCRFFFFFFGKEIEQIPSKVAPDSTSLEKFLLPLMRNVGLDEGKQGRVKVAGPFSIIPARSESMGRISREISHGPDNEEGGEGNARKEGLISCPLG